jgi:sorting and assembly machinery component 37
MASPPLVLHIWAVPPSPAAWGVPSLDPACAAAVLALALAAPGAHAVHVASTPDGAPGGARVPARVRGRG